MLFGFLQGARRWCSGSAWVFASAILIMVIWGLTGPAFHYSDTWQLIINAGTTIVTFLMVFLIQNTRNRDAKAAHLKLDEIIRALKGARNDLSIWKNLPTKVCLALRNSSSESEKKQNGKRKNSWPHDQCHAAEAIIAAKKNDVTAYHRYSPLDRSRRLKRVEADRMFRTP
jgi:low affinity Fe/Cu permease